MSEALEQVISDESRGRLAVAIAYSGSLTPHKLDDLAQSLEMTTGDVVALLNDPQFRKTLQAITRAQSSLILHGQGVRRLTEIAVGGEDKDALQALTMLGKLSGDFRAGHSIDVKISFEELRRRAESKPSPHQSDIFAIDAEVIDDSDTD